MKRNLLLLLCGTFFMCACVKNDNEPPVITSPLINTPTIAHSVASVQTELDGAIAKSGVIAITLDTPVSQTSSIAIPAMIDATTTPAITLNLASGIASDQTLVIMEQPTSTNHYTGEVHINVNESAAADLIVLMPYATIFINGKLHMLQATMGTQELIIENGAQINSMEINKGTVDVYGAVEHITALADSKVFWGVKTYQELIDAIAKPAPNDGVIMAANIEVAATTPTTTGMVTLTKQGYTLDGAGFTLSGSVNEASRGETNVLTVAANDITVKNLTLTNRTKHGMTIYRVTGVKLDNLKLTNNAAGGMIVNGSDVEASNIVCTNNAWYGINVAKGSGVTETPHLTMSGVNSSTNTLIYAESKEGIAAATSCVSGDVYIQSANYAAGTHGTVWGATRVVAALGFDWIADRTMPNKWSVTPEFISLETVPAVNPAPFYDWHGIKTNCGTTPSNSWSVESALTIDNSVTDSRQSIWLNVMDVAHAPDNVDWAIISYKNRDGVKTWEWFDANGESGWNSLTTPSSSTANGTHTIKFVRTGDKTEIFIDGVLEKDYVATGISSTYVKEIMFNSQTSGVAYPTKWAYPVYTGN